MNEELAVVIIFGIIGVTVMTSTVVLAITRVVTSRRRQELADEQRAGIEARLSRIEHAVDAVATEVERVAADQRFASHRLAARPDDRR
jgi:hypothetical protein